MWRKFSENLIILDILRKISRKRRRNFFKNWENSNTFKEYFSELREKFRGNLWENTTAATCYKPSISPWEKQRGKLGERSAYSLVLSIRDVIASMVLRKIHLPSDASKLGRRVASVRNSVTNLRFDSLRHSSGNEVERRFPVFWEENTVRGLEIKFLRNIRRNSKIFVQENPEIFGEFKNIPENSEIVGNRKRS